MPFRPSATTFCFSCTMTFCTTVSHITSLIPFSFPSRTLRFCISASSSATRALDASESPFAAGCTKNE
jgi:hypothetical protein